MNIVNENFGEFVTEERRRINKGLVASVDDKGAYNNLRPRTLNTRNYSNEPKNNNRQYDNQDLSTKWSKLLGRELSEVEKLSLNLSKEEKKKFSITKQVEMMEALENLKSELNYNKMMNKMKGGAIKNH